MKTNILSIYFCSVLVICFFATQVNAQRVYGVRDSTVYVINSLDTIIAGKHKLYKKQGASLNLIKEFNDTLGVPGFTERAWIRDFDFWDSQNWYVLIGWRYAGGSTILYKTINAGINWTIDTSYYNQSQQHNQSLNQVQIVDSQKAFLFDGYYSSDVIRTNDGGNTWQRWLESTMFANHRGIFICNDTTYYLWGSPGDPWMPYMFPVPISAFNSLYYQVDCHLNPDCINATGIPINDQYTADLEGYFTPIFNSLCSQVVSVNEDYHQDQIVIYPNPNNGKFTLMLGNETEKGIVEIYNAFGQRIYQSAITNQKTEIELNSSKTGGIYFVKFYNKLAILTKVIVIQK